MCGSGPYQRLPDGKLDDNNLDTVEVIDLIDPTFKKVIKSNLPKRDFCFSGIVGNQPFFGGGWTSDKDVLVLNKAKNKVNMSTSRSQAAISKMSENIHWVSGGIDYNYQSLDSSEIVEYKPEEDKWIVRGGMDLPVCIYDHSIIKWDEDTTFMIGGVTGGNYDSDLEEDEQEEPETERKTWIFDVEDGFLDIRLGPSMYYPRSDFQSAIMMSKGRRVIVVVGGNDGHWCHDSVEILDPGSLEGWKKGKSYHSSIYVFMKRVHNYNYLIRSKNASQNVSFCYDSIS